MRKTFSVIIIIAMICSFSTPAFAGDINWDGSQNTGTWGDPLNWAGGVVPAGGDNAHFVDGGGTVDLINLGGTVPIGSVIFENAGVAAYTLGVAGVDTLTLTNGAGIVVNAGVLQTETVAANLSIVNAALSNNGNAVADTFLLNVTGNIASTAAGTLTLNGVDTDNNIVSGAITDTSLAEALNVTKSEAGKWILSGNNSYRGVTTVGAGTLIATNSANALGAGALTMSGGKLQLANDSSLAFNRNTTVTANSEIDTARVLAAGAGTTHTLGTLSIGNFTLTAGIGDALTTSGVQGLTFGDVTLTGDATINAVSNYGGTATGLLTLGNVTSGGNKLTLSSASATAITMGTMADLGGVGKGLTITDAGGLVTVGTIGNTATGVVTITDSSAGVTFSGNVTSSTFTITDTTDDQAITFADGQTVAIATLATAAQNYDVIVNSSTFGVTNDCDFLNTGTVTLGDDASDNITFTGGLNTTTGPTTVNAAGTVNTTNTRMDIGAVTLTAATTFDTGNAAVGILNVGAVTGAFGLTLDSGSTAGATIGLTSMTDLTGGLTIRDAGGLATIGAVGTGTAGNITITDSQAGVTFSGAVTANTLTITDTANTQTVTFSGNTTINTALTTTANAYNVAFNGTTNAITPDTSFLNTGTVTLGNGAGDTTTFTGGLDTTNGPSGTNIAGTVATTNTQMDLGAATMTAASTLNSSGGAINVASVDNGGFLLTINAGAGASAIPGVVSGTGGLTKAGTGTLTLSGTNTYSGTTTINTGTVTVSNSSALGTGAGGVLHNATLNIGSTTLNLGGTYTQGGAATLMVNVNGTSSGSIVATGACTVTTTDTLTLNVSNYVPNNTTYTIIDGGAAGAIAAPIITVTGDTRATFAATTVGNDLILTASRASNGFASNATTGDSNAAAVGNVLDNITNPTGDMQTVLNTLNGLSASQTAAALDTLVPEVDGGVINTSTTTLNNFVGVAMDRVENILKTAQNTTDTAKTGFSAGDENKNKLNGMWAKGYGSYLTQGTRQGIRGYDAWNAGTALGVDHLFMDCVTLGVSGGYAYGNVDSDANNANTYINSAQTTLYGGYQHPDIPVFVDMAGSFAYNWYNGTRDINVGPTISRTANAQYDGQQYGAYIGTGYTFNIAKNFELTPLLSLQWNHLHLQSYTETEAGALGLSVGSQDYDQLQSGLGARLAAPIKCAWGTFTPEAHGKWYYDFLGQNMVVTSTFTGGGAAFNGDGFRPAVNSYNAGGKLTFDFKNDISVTGDCDTQMMEDFFGIYGSVTVRYSF